MEVAIFNKQRTLSLNNDQVAAIAKEVVALEQRCYDEVAIHFIGTKAMCQLHGKYFNDFSLTDCISFPMHNTFDLGYSTLGEVFVCTQVAFAYARKWGSDPYQEATRYMVHGLLHLLGYDDIKKKERSYMREAEERLLGHLQKKGLILQKKS